MEHAHCDEVCDDSGEGGSDGEEEPAVSLPEFAEAGGLGEDIRDVGCAVGDVRYDRQQEKAQPEIKRERCLGRGISGCEVDDHDGCKRQIVDKAPTFPEFDGVSDVVPQTGGVHRNKSNLVRAASAQQQPGPPWPSVTGSGSNRLIFSDNLGSIRRKVNGCKQGHSAQNPLDSRN